MQKKDFLQWYSVIIPSNRSFDDILPLLQCLGKQSIKAFEVIVVYDKVISEIEFEKYQKKAFSVFEEKNWQKLIDIDNLDIKITIVSKWVFSSFEVGKWASYVRNFWIKLVKTKYLLCVDDDNEFNDKFVEDLIDRHEETKKEKVIIPTELYRKTDKIRSMWYIWFNYFLWRPISVKSEKYNKKTGFLPSQEWQEKTSLVLNHWGKKDFFENDLVPIQFSSSNCLFWDTILFQNNLFDEDIPFIYEDFIMTKGLSVSCQDCLLVATDVFINHMMRDKTKIEDLYVSNSFWAYQKWRNRVIFVKRFWKKYQKNNYFVLWLWLHTLYLILMILIYKKEDRFKIIKSLLKGTVKWIMN